MPFTINGIGTHYYGRGNASARRGVCEFCKRTTTLTSFDTRECFCVVFIPLVPIAKYRIFDECSSCRKHRRIKASDFQQQVEGHVGPLRQAVKVRPSDSTAWQSLVRELASMRMNTEAETAARDAVSALPEDATLNMLAGQILAGKGDLPGAAAFFERSVHFDSANADARLSFGRVKYLQGDYVAAARQLEEAHRLAPSNTTITFLLADSYTNLQRWPDALPLWQQIPRPDKSVLRRIAECKKALGYELHPSEKRAARTWWPFRRRRPARIKPVTSITSSSLVSGKRVLIGVGLVIGVFIMAGIAVSLWGLLGRHSVDVYFDATIARPTFVIDGEKFRSDVQLPWRKSLSPGKHTIAVLDAHGKQIESRAINIDEPDFGDAITSDTNYIYNAGAQRVYRRESVEYTVNTADSHYSYELLGDQSFFPVRNIDYLFVTPPESIDLPSGRTSETKTALETESDFNLHDYGMYKLRRDDVNAAQSAFKHALQFDACDTDSRAMLAALRIGAGAVDEGLAVARDGLTACSTSMLESHRVYQDALSRAGKRDEAVAMYRQQLTDHPDSAVFHYLYGRIAPTTREEIAEQREALRLDPKLARAHAALGYSLIGTGEYEDAMHEIASAIENGVDDDNATLHYVYAAIGASRAEEAQTLVESAAKKRPAWNSRWLLALAGKKWTTAQTLYAQRAKFDPTSDVTWWTHLVLLRLQGDNDAVGKHISAAERNSKLLHVTNAARIEMLLEDGKWNDAIAAIDQDAASLIPAPRYRFELYGAAAAMMAGDKAGANRRIAAVRKAAEEDKELTDLELDAIAAQIAALDGTATPDGEVNALRDDILELKHAWFFLGAHARATGDTVRAHEYFEKSARASFDLQFPMVAAQRLAGS